MSVHLILGPMFSGKTTELNRLLRRYTLAQKKSFSIKHGSDLRYSTGDEMTTHDMISVPARRFMSLDEIPIEELEDVVVITIDEAQWFDNVAEFADKWAYNGKHVILAALNGDSTRKSLEQTNNLLAISNTVTKLLAVCACGEEAPFSRRLSDETEVKVIGGADKYIAQCRKCFIDFPSRGSL
jgi:thymidine kinase